MEISKRRFRSWLGTQDYNSTVGYPKEPQGCPIATFVTSYYGVDDTFVSVDGISYTNCRGETDRVTPPWAKQFIRRADKYRTPITAKTAIKILETL